MKNPLAFLLDVPDGTPVSVTLGAGEYTVGQLLALRGGRRETRWVNTSTAAALTGMEDHQIRRGAQRWRNMQDPPIRVQKDGPGKRSSWLYAEQDCLAYARNVGRDPEITAVDGGADGEVVDVAEEIAARLVP